MIDKSLLRICDVNGKLGTDHLIFKTYLNDESLGCFELSFFELSFFEPNDILFRYLHNDKGIQVDCYVNGNVMDLETYFCLHGLIS